tara:strand:- start:29 stop:298 length:270 start_codon:yes stop_codon:yes gene_type:complete
MSSPEGQIKMQTIIGTIQLFVLILGVASIFLTIGQRDQRLTGNTESLSELQSIVQELVKSQVAGATKDSEHDRVLLDLQTRVNRLETNR